MSAMGMELIQDLGVVLLVAAAAGWACRRAGISSVVGYLAAGLLTGPYTPPFQWVGSVERVRMLADLGLVFVIFGVGLGLSLGRMRRLGARVGIATMAGALIVLNACRFAGLWLGWDATTGLFLAGMLMVSSSAVISKSLEELQGTHERWGQMALGVTVMEDVVAVVMLTVLTSMGGGGGAGGLTGAGGQVWTTLWRLGAFVVLLVFLGALVVPRVLRGMARDGAVEARTLLMAGMVMGTSWAANAAGYSPALGAFLLGVLVAGTPFRMEAERVFDGVRQMFGAVFFVAVGMLLDVRQLGEAWPMVAAATVVALVLRPVACATGLMLSGHGNRDSIRAGLACAPLGEFSFVMAQLGEAKGMVPGWFTAVAVGASLGTAVGGPWLMRRSEGIAGWVVEREPRVLRESLALYHGWLERLGTLLSGSMVWRLVSGRLARGGLNLLFVTALLLFWHPAVEAMVRGLGEDVGTKGGTRALFWVVFGLLLMGPLVALWRSSEAIAMVVAEGATQGRGWARPLRPWLELGLKAIGVLGLGAWLVAFLPLGGASPWVVTAAAGFVGVAGLLLSARLVRWHGRIEGEVRAELKRATTGTGALGMDLPGANEPGGWDLEIAEVTLPSGTMAGGRSLRELGMRRETGCSVLVLERGGVSRLNPGPDEVLYPGDRLLLLGPPERLPEAERWLAALREGGDSGGWLGDATSETLWVPAGCVHAGLALGDWTMTRETGVQVCGIQRGRERVVMPDPSQKILAGDRLLVVGPGAALARFRDWLGSGVLPAAGPMEGLARG